MRHQVLVIVAVLHSLSACSDSGGSGPSDGPGPLDGGPDVPIGDAPRQLDGAITTDGASPLDGRTATDLTPTGCQHDAAVSDDPWALAGTSAGQGHGWGIGVDNDRNIYVTGYFNDEMTIGGKTLVSQGARDLFLAKLSSGGELLWAHSAGSSGDDEGKDLAVDPETGAVYVAGFFRDQIDLGNGQTLSAVGGTLDTDSFVAKFDCNGNAIWAEPVASSGSNDWLIAITLDQQKNPHVTGMIDKGATLGPDTLVVHGYGDVITAKLAQSNGEILWARSAGETPGDQGPTLGWDQGRAIAVASGGEVYITGYFKDDITFAEGTAQATELISTGGEDIFVAKYSSDGTLAWAKSSSFSGADSGERGKAIAIDGQKIYVAGYTLSAIDPSEGTARFDLFISQYDVDGNPGWSALTGGDSPNLYIEPNGLAIDDAGNLLVTGIYNDPVSFGATPLPYAGDLQQQIFVARCSPGGQFDWATSTGAAGWDEPSRIVFARNGRGEPLAHLTGQFARTVDFGGQQLTAQAANLPNVFVWRLTLP